MYMILASIFGALADKFVSLYVCKIVSSIATVQEDWPKRVILGPRLWLKNRVALCGTYRVAIPWQYLV